MVPALPEPWKHLDKQLSTQLDYVESSTGMAIEFQWLYWWGVNDVTQILNAMEQGDAQAADKLLPLVYDELRRLAAQKLAQEAPGQTLQATSLVHEAYLRLVDVRQPQRWQGRRHFFAAAAEAIRRILVERARQKRALKRGGNLVRQAFDEAIVAAPETPTTCWHWTKHSESSPRRIRLPPNGSSSAISPGLQ